MSIDFETCPLDTVLATFFAEARTENGALFVIVKCNKTITALLLVQYENLWSPKKQYQPRPWALVNIVFWTP